MNTPVIWIFVPLITACLGFFLRRWKTAVTISLSLVSILLAIGAWQIRIGELLTLGSWSFTIDDHLIIAGRQFILGNSDRPYLVIIYLTVSFFFCGSLASGINKLFVPLGLGMSAIFVASLSVVPFLYAALFIELAVLVGVLLLSPPGNPVDRGVLRYVTFLSLGFPFMLIGGDILSNFTFIEAQLTDLFPALVLLGFGFAFLLAVFPLNSWIPVLLERINPFQSAFILSILPLTVIAFLSRFIRQYPWLIDLDIIQLCGVIMIVTGGLWVAFQRNIARMLGYAISIDVGYSLLAICLPEGTHIYSGMLIARILAFGVWALALSLLIPEVDDFSFRSVQGFGRKMPIIVLGILIPHFSLSGLPLLASFPWLLSLWGQLTKISSLMSLLVLLSSAGLLIGALRSLAVFVMGPDKLPPPQTSIRRLSQVFLLIGIFMIVAIGIFPQIVYFLVASIFGIV